MGAVTSNLFTISTSAMHKLKILLLLSWALVAFGAEEVQVNPAGGLLQNPAFAPFIERVSLFTKFLNMESV